MISPSHIVRSAICLSIRAASVISYVRTMELCIIDKSGLRSGVSSVDPTTIADHLSQNIIKGGLVKLYAGLNVIGEEDDEMKYEMAEEILSAVKEQEVDISLLDKFTHSDEKYELKRVKIFVDPLDGTKEYTKGVFEAVTILIGICVDGKPVAGVVNYPFNNSVYWGINGVGTFKILNWDPRTIQKLEIPSLLHTNCIAVSASHMTNELKLYLDALSETRVPSGGCGAKCLQLLEGKIDAYVHPVVGTKKWDTAACDALINIAGGKFTDGLGHPINYDDLNLSNERGLICSSLENHAKFIKLPNAI